MSSQSISSSWGDDVLSISEQVDVVIKKSLELDSVDELFGGNKRLGEHAYYVVGFLNHAGMKEKDRRTD